MCLHSSSGTELRTCPPEPLPLTVVHHPLEPATSLISHLAARHGAASSTDFCRDIGLPYKTLLRGDRAAIEQLARLAGCDADALARISIRNLGRNALRLRDEIATTHTLHRSRIRVCPGCYPTGCWVCWGSLSRASTGDMAVCFYPVLSSA